MTEGHRKVLADASELVRRVALDLGHGGGGRTSMQRAVAAMLLGVVGQLNSIRALGEVPHVDV